MLEERLPKKVQFLIKRGRPLYHCLLSLESRHFYLWNAQCGTVQRPDSRSKDSRFWQAVTAFSLLRPARFSDALCCPLAASSVPAWHKRPLRKLSALLLFRSLQNYTLHQGFAGRADAPQRALMYFLLDFFQISSRLFSSCIFCAMILYFSVAGVCSDRSRLNKEAGENPARSRRCK